jgi:hypothetical protein
MECARCTTELPAEARYCFRCGLPLQRAITGATQRLDALLPAPVLLGDWFEIDSYAGCVHEYRDEVVYDNGILKPAHVRSLRILIELVNESADPLRYHLDQWRLVDMQGFSYESQLRTQFYAADAAQRLVEGTLTAGRRLRAWVAFQLPATAQPHYIQVQLLPRSKSIVEVLLQYPADQE